MAAVDLSPSWVPHAHSHRRGHSASSGSFRFPAARRQRSLDPIPNDDDRDADPAPPPSFHAAKIKPYLRKLSLRDGSTTAPVDLSRPAAENESIAALGFYDEARAASDLGFAGAGGVASRSRHQRSASNTSNFSTSSRPNPPLAFPLRHTPRPYTPPIARSYAASSLVDSDDSDELDHAAADDEFRARQRTLDSSHRSGSLGELPSAPQPPPPPLHSSSSLTRLNNASQTSLPTTSRSRGDTLRSVDTATVPSSTRTSLDKAIGFFRATTTAASSLKEEVTLDPATARAASIQLARIKYAEREEAKERKAEKDALRARDKANRRAAQREERQRRRSESSVRGAGTGAGGLPLGSSSEKLGLIGRAYDEYQPAHLRTLPAHVPTATTAAAAPGGAALAAAKDARVAGQPQASSMRVRWLGFVAWFRTRLLRIKRSMTS